MQRPSRLRAPFLATAVLWALPAVAARAQYFPGGDPSVSSAGGTGSNINERYNKAKKGANLSEWVRRLGDEDPNRRLEAVKSLGDSNDAKAVDYLMQAVGDTDPRIQSKAVDYLGKLRATDATVFLIQKLFTVGTNRQLRHRILFALGKIGDPRAGRPILEYVEQGNDPDIRGAGIYAIGEIADDSVREDLKRFGEQEPDARLRRLASDALFKIATRRPQQAMRDPSSFPTALDAALSTDR